MRCAVEDDHNEGNHLREEDHFACGCKMDNALEVKQQVELPRQRRRRTELNDSIVKHHQRTTLTLSTTTSQSAHWLLAHSLSQLLLLLLLMIVGGLVEGAMNLPDGIENILGFVPRSSFKCERDGYFGDIDNDCRLFHLCQRQVGQGGRVEWRHWTYACGNQTMFNQLTLTCAFVDEAIPCRHASQFQYLNEVIHKPAEPFLTDADVTSGFSYYSNRVMSDGARQRAFEDSHLLAQVGGAYAGGSASAASSGKPKQHKLLVPASPPAGTAVAPSVSHQQLNPFETSSLTSTFTNTFTNTFGHPSSLQDALQNSLQNSLAGSSPTPAPFQDLAGPVELATSRSFQFQSQPGGATIASAPSDKSQAALFAPAPNAAVAIGAKPQESSQFEFSITTSHQANSPSEPANVIFRQQPVAGPSTQPPASPTTAAAAAATSTTATTTTTATTSSTATNPTASDQQQSPSGVTQNPALVATFTSANRLQAAQTQVTTLVTPTTSTATVAPTLVQASGAAAKPQQTATATRRAVATSSGRALRAGFQSTRLSSGAGQQQPRRQTQPASIVMRKPTTRLASGGVSGDPPGGHSKPLASSALLEAQSQTPVWSASGDFWRRSFDSQLMAPKFESLLLRRRV